MARRSAPLSAVWIGNWGDNPPDIPFNEVCPHLATVSPPQSNGLTCRRVFFDPKVTILLGQVITSGKLPKYSYIPELNKELASLAARLSKSGYQVTLVNHADGFDWKTDTLEDKVHPNASGAKKMAEKWMAALLPLLSKENANRVPVTD